MEQVWCGFRSGLARRSKFLHNYPKKPTDGEEAAGWRGSCSVWAVTKEMGADITVGRLLRRPAGFCSTYRV
jgi:hypothetical protein